MRRVPDTRAFLDAHTGEVVFLTRGWSEDHEFSENDLAEALAAHRLVAVEAVPLGIELGWREAFVASLEDDWPKDALAAALATQTPLRSFEAALGRYPAERLRWLACLSGRVQAVLRAWLEAHELEPETEPETGSPRTGGDGQSG